jgi:hypothetical protein
MNPLELDWNKIALELEEELDRKPSTVEIQRRLVKKYWEMIDFIEKNDTIEK